MSDSKKGLFIPLLLGLGLISLGGVLLEAIWYNPIDVLIIKILGIIMGLIIFIPGILIFIFGVTEVINVIKGRDKEIERALNTVEKPQEDPLKELLVNFRKHYSDFFESIGIKENEKIQWEATQLYRNILEFRKNRLKRLNITCETIVKHMQTKYTDGIAKYFFSDGKYDITEVEEEIAARDIYKRDGKEIHKQTNKDLACYTIIHTKHSSDDKIICPSCGVEATREELLDGCDYCGTKFMIEDLGDRVAEFALRPDYDIAYAKYKAQKARILWIARTAIVAVVLIGITIFSIVNIEELFINTDDMGIITKITAFITAIVGTSALLIFLLSVVFSWVFPLIALSDVISQKLLEKIKVSPERDKSFTEIIQKYDPNFSIANFYTNLQNKISSIIYADTKAQINAFVNGDLSSYLGKYSDVINIETQYMGITNYVEDETFQNAVVEVSMKLLELKGDKCKTRDEYWRLKLIKSAACKTQVVCAPSIMTCKSCGISLDLLKGKECSYCGNKLELENYDWVIQDIELMEVE